MLFRSTTNTSSSSSNRNSCGSRAAVKRGSRHVASRAPGTFFFLFSFYYTNFYLDLDLRLYYEGLNVDIGPKRLRIASFGPSVSIFYLFIEFYILTKSVHRFSNVPKRRDPNDGYTVVWAPVLLYYAQPLWQCEEHLPLL